MIKVISGLLSAIIFGIILFLINPILGVLWILWLVGLTIYTLKKGKK